LVVNRVFGWPLKVTINQSTGFNWKFVWSGLTNLEPQWIPEGFDYDTWLGPAPTKPYSQHRTHVTFRGYWDYDGGGLGDMGQHYLDPLYPYPTIFRYYSLLLEVEYCNQFQIQVDYHLR